MTHLDEQAILAINRDGWDAVAERFFGVTALPEYGPLAMTEDTLGLLGSISDKRVLEVGCGSGHSLAYLARQGAAEVWGIDLSQSQIGAAQAVAVEQGFTARLFVSPMEENPGIPVDYFDLIVSIYALGWTVDLSGTLRHIYSYLKPGGTFIFSWEHPTYGGLEYENETYVFKNSYHAEGPVMHPTWNGVPIVITHRKMSTFINSAVAAGFEIQQLIESAVNPTLAGEVHHLSDRWYNLQRAQLCPTTFILKLGKPSVG